MRHIIRVHLRSSVVKNLRSTCFVTFVFFVVESFHLDLRGVVR